VSQATQEKLVTEGKKFEAYSLGHPMLMEQAARSTLRQKIEKQPKIDLPKPQNLYSDKDFKLTSSLELLPSTIFAMNFT
jgi:hypothetical protein